MQKELLEHIREAKTPKEAWDSFGALFSRANDARLQLLENEIGTLTRKVACLSCSTLHEGEEWIENMGSSVVLESFKRGKVYQVWSLLHSNNQPRNLCCLMPKTLPLGTEGSWLSTAVLLFANNGLLGFLNHSRDS